MFYYDSRAAEAASVSQIPLTRSVLTKVWKSPTRPISKVLFHGKYVYVKLNLKLKASLISLVASARDL